MLCRFGCLLQLSDLVAYDHSQGKLGDGAISPLDESAASTGRKGSALTGFLHGLGWEYAMTYHDSSYTF